MDAERGPLSQPSVRQALQNFVRLRIDYTDRSPHTGSVMGDLNISSLPSFVFLDGGGQEVARIEGPPTVRRLEDGIAKAAPR